MRSNSMLCACRLQFFGPIAMLLLIPATSAPAQINHFNLHDSRFHFTNNTALWS